MGGSNCYEKMSEGKKEQGALAIYDALEKSGITLICCVI